MNVWEIFIRIECEVCEGSEIDEKWGYVLLCWMYGMIYFKFLCFIICLFGMCFDLGFWNFIK